MMTTFKIPFHVIVHTMLLNHVISQNNLCLCDDPRFESQWGTWYSVKCIGMCEHSNLYGSAECKVNLNQMMHSTVCSRRIVKGCIEESSCLGAWGTWSTIGTCTAVCGYGIQSESRACYKKGETNNLRFNGCGTGQIDEYRNKTCERRNNCFDPSTKATTQTTRTSSSPISTTIRLRTTSSSVTKATKQETVAIRTTTTTTTTTEASTVTKQTTRAVVQTVNETMLGNRNNANREPNLFLITTNIPTFPNSSGFYTMLLAAILGTAALFCVTAVAVAVIVVFMKKKRPENCAVYPNGSVGSMLMTVSGNQRNIGTYESTGENLTPRWTEHRFKPDNREPLPMNNAIHETNTYNNTAEPILYMEPSPNKTAESESVYFSIDDRDR